MILKGIKCMSSKGTSSDAIAVQQALAAQFEQMCSPPRGRPGTDPGIARFPIQERGMRWHYRQEMGDVKRPWVPETPAIIVGGWGRMGRLAVLAGYTLRR